MSIDDLGHFLQVYDIPTGQPQGQLGNLLHAGEAAADTA